MANFEANPASAKSTAHIPPELHGVRLDKALASCFPDYSRAILAQQIDAQQVWHNGILVQKARQPVAENDLLEIILPEQIVCELKPENLNLNIIYEDEYLLIVYKPAGLVSHPGAGNPDGTLVNGLLHHHADLEKLPRAGLIHRLDKDTSGILLVAKTQAAQTRLVGMMQARDIHREYQAIVNGHLTSGGTVDAPLDRDARDRTRYAVAELGGRDAVTHYRVMTRFTHHTQLALKLETGRTHQIRVHMAHIKHPLVGDPVYGGRFARPKGAPQALVDGILAFKRQALHARRLAFVHPITGEDLDCQVPAPKDYQNLLKILGEY